MRAVAVLLVVLFHVSAPGFGGGYLGVDMFFVLSGYLITAGLLREIAARERPDLTRFWLRRFKRLMPAAVLVIAVVLLWSAWGAETYRRATIAEDAWWTALYLANWRFIDSASYFASDGTSSPLLHMWSLAVEEQFYLGWPLIVALIAWLAARRRRGRHARVSIKPILATVAAALAVLSAVLLWVLFDPASPERAYMGTDTKALEPMLGSLLAIVLASERARTRVTRHTTALTALGVAGILILPGGLVGASPAYFRGAALAFSIAMAALIVGLVLAPTSRVARVLSWAPASYLGRISYGIYLWHWPYAVWLGTPHTTFSWWRALLLMVCTLVTAALSYHLLEMPVREGRFSAWFTARRTVVAALTVLVVVTGSATALGGTPWAGQVRATAPGSDGPNQKIVLLVGDSVPRRLTPFLAPVADERGRTLVSAAAGGCSPLAVVQHAGPGETSGDRCAQLADRQSELIRQYDPGTVIWWSRYEVADRYVDSKLVRAGSPEFWSAQEVDFTRAVERLTSRGATLVVVLTERPGIGLLTRCTPTECAPFANTLLHHDEWRVRWNDHVRAIAAVNPRVRTISVDDLVCRSSPNLWSTGVPTSPEPAASSATSLAEGTSGEPSGLCDDTVSQGRLARPDGSHFDNDLVGQAVATGVLDRAFAAAAATR